MNTTYDAVETVETVQARPDAAVLDSWFDRWLNSPYEGSRVALFAKVMLALDGALVGLWVVQTM